MLQEVTKNRVIPRVMEDHEKMHNDDPVTITDAQMDVGENVDQGDVKIVRIKSLPKNRTVRQNRQIAEGSTQGSRHVLEVGDLYDSPPEDVAAAIKEACGIEIGTQYCGPVFATKNGCADLTHPEHGNHCYRGENMSFASVYQRNLDAEEMQERRARD